MMPFTRRTKSRALVAAAVALLPVSLGLAADPVASVLSAVADPTLIPSVQPASADPLPPLAPVTFPPIAQPGNFPLPAYAKTEPLPIDLPTVLRLINENSPVIRFAQARVWAAQARLERAEVAWLPDFAAGVNYNRFDGQTQNQRGEVFGVSRANLFGSGGIILRVDTADVYFGTLIARRLAGAEQQSALQSNIDAQLEGVLAYFDLMQVYGQLAVAADTLEKAEVMLRYARNAREAALSKTAADVNRAEAEVYIRKQERIDLQARAGAASARLARVLLLPPTIDLRPTDAEVVPIVMIDESCSLDDLVATALRNRPDLAAAREMVAASEDAVKQAKLGPFLPRLVLEQQTGGFGGGTNDFLGDFSARTAINAGVYWDLKSLGFGDVALTRERRAELEQSLIRLIATQARAGAEVSESAKVAAAKYSQLDAARKAVSEAAETYRKLRESSFNMIGPRAQYDALEPLTAIQQLNQARLHFLAAVIDFNRAQFRLFSALGYPVTPVPASPRETR